MDDVDEETSSWKKWVIGGIAAVIVIVLGIVAALVVGIAAIAGAGAGCVPAASTSSMSAASSSSTTATPDELEVPYGSNGTTTLNAKQLANAQAIINRASQRGISPQGIKIALMTALQESKLRMYANSTVPESLGYPHEAVGSDHDSVGLFQQRPPGWGSVKELMTIDYSVDAFFGGPEGPNGGSPRGLLDITGWETMSPGKAAQTVQVSAFPSAYDKWEPAADLLIQTLGTGGGSCTAAGDMNGMALPLKSDYNMTSGYGPRDTGISGASTWHAAIDLQRWPNPCGDPVYAILPGEVVLSSSLWLSIKHADGFVVSYLHTYKSERLVDVGDTIIAGQEIAAVGNVPPSSGCHLDIRINVSENTNPQVAALQRSEALGATGTNRNFVNPEEFTRLWGVEICPPDTCRRP